MFSNIGRKIQVTGKVFCWIGIILSVFGGVAVWFSVYAATRSMGQGVIAGLLTMVLSALLSWVGSFTMIGFGKLVESSEITAANTTRNQY